MPTTDFESGETLTATALNSSFAACAAETDMQTIQNGTATSAGTLTGTEVVTVSRGAGPLATALSAIAQFVQTAFSWVAAAGTGATSRTTQMRFLDMFSAMEFCAGDGATDDTANLVNAEAEAFALGKVLFFPSGRTFLTNGTFNCRVPIYGVGAKIQQTNTGTVSSFEVGTVVYTGISAVEVHGLTIDSASSRGGLILVNCIGARVYDVHSINIAGLGFGAYGTTGAYFFSCTATNIIYPVNTIGTAGSAADGFTFAGSQACRVVDCYATNFQRIGFVSDINGTVKSDNIIFERCYAKNANNCDLSTTEYNAAFWQENTNNGLIIDCVGENISSGVGQTSARVRGWTLGAGQSAYGNIVVRNVRIWNNTAVMPMVGTIGVSGGYTNVHVSDVYGENANTGIQISNEPLSLVIDNPTFASMTYANGAQAGILLNTTAASGLSLLEISRYNTTSALNSYATDSADICIYNSPNGGTFNLRNCKNSSLIVTHQANVWNEVNVENCNLTYGSASFPAFRTQTLNCYGSNDLVPNVGGTGQLFYSAGITGGTWRMRGSNVLTSPSAIQIEIGGTNNSFDWQGVVFNNVNWKVSTSGTFVNAIDGCTFNGMGTTGAIQWGYNNPVNGQLWIRGTQFIAPTNSIVPVQKWNYNPTSGSITSSYWNTTSLTNTNLPFVSPTFLQAFGIANNGGAGYPGIFERDNSGSVPVGRLLTGDSTGYGGLRIGSRNSSGVVADYVTVNDTTGIVGITNGMNVGGTSALTGLSVSAPAVFDSSATVSYAGPSFYLNDTSGSNSAGVRIQSAGVTVWTMIATAAGANFTINRYASGVAVDTPLGINKTSGAVSLSQPLQKSSFAFSALPSATSFAVGAEAFCTNGRNNGEGAGAGTGCPVFVKSISGTNTWCAVWSGVAVTS